MSVIFAGLSSAILAQWASKKRAQMKQSQLDKLCSVPVIPISGLNSLLPQHDNNNVVAKKLVFVRGVVLPVSSTCLGSLHMSYEFGGQNNGIVRSTRTELDALVIEERTTVVYHKEAAGLMRFKPPTGKKITCKKRKQVPFVISNSAKTPCTEYVIVTLDCSEQRVPLQRVCKVQKQIFNNVENSSKLHVDESIEEEILPLGSVLSAVGLFTSENGIPTIKPCPNLDFFLTAKTKEELISELSDQVTSLLKTSNILSKLSMGLAGYAILTFMIRLISKTSAHYGG